MTKEAYSIPEFCETHGISRGTFYNLQKIGKSPRLMRVAHRVPITREAAADWRRQMEEPAPAVSATEMEAA